MDSRTEMKYVNNKSLIMTVSASIVTNAFDGFN
jgi:hypothetical protein